MSYRQTYVIEYPDASHAPRVGYDMEMLGGKLISCQFSDALEELDALRECCDPGDMARAHQLQMRMVAERG